MLLRQTKYTVTPVAACGAWCCAAGTVNIITGSAGCKEQHEPFTLPQPPYTAFRSNTYGYSRMFIHNDTHLEWQQVMTDNGQPKSMMGKVIDHFWLVQDHHGPFQG